nr:MAG TPA: hypothetical protein [Caudoviricetes sp.]
MRTLTKRPLEIVVFWLGHQCHGQYVIMNV